MSYDFYMAIDTGGEEPHWIEPFFSDGLPALMSDGVAGTAVLTATGYARCGNYTSNVSGIWSKCLTAAMKQTPIPGRLRPWRRRTWKAWAGDDDRWRRENYPAQKDRPINTERMCLLDLQGKPADQIAPLLRAAVDWGIEHLDELREMNPENGWGDAEGAVTYLWDIQRMCEQHPRATLRISS
jgi:hypothetical protein